MNPKFYTIIKKLYLQHGIQPTDFNLFGIRNAYNQVQDSFNDYIGFFTDFESEIFLYKGTTDPGVWWTTNPSNVSGTAHLCLGYHKDIWVIEKHQGLYTALCNRWNCNPTRIWRDTNKDIKYNQVSDKLETGRFGINLHRAAALQNIEKIGKYSAGCQVIQKAEDFNVIIKRAIDSEQKKFSYFLFDKSQVSFFNEL